jgi:hypothetical protein
MRRVRQDRNERVTTRSLGHSRKRLVIWQVDSDEILRWVAVVRRECDPGVVLRRFRCSISTVLGSARREATTGDMPPFVVASSSYSPHLEHLKWTFWI